MEGAHPNHHRIILLCNGGNIDYPKKVLQKLRIPMQFPTKRGRFNSFISSQWVSSTNHRPKNCAGSHRAAREGGSHSSQTRCILVLVSQLGWDPVRGRDIISIYIYTCNINVSIYIYIYLYRYIHTIYIYVYMSTFFLHNSIYIYYMIYYNHSYTLSTKKYFWGLQMVSVLGLASALQFPWFTAPMFHGCTSDIPRYWKLPSKPNLTIVPSLRKKGGKHLFFMEPLAVNPRLQHWFRRTFSWARLIAATRCFRGEIDLRLDRRQGCAALHD